MPKRIEHKIDGGIEYKLCSTHSGWCVLSDFYKCKSLWDGLSGRCKECDKVACHSRYKRNSNEINLRNKRYYQQNKDRINEKNKEYISKHRNEINAYKSQWQKDNRQTRNARLRERYKNEPNYRLAVLLRTRLQKALDNNQKTGHTLELLGCSIDEFKNHLEKQFYGDMTWDNHGVCWHIDHIKPCSKFNLVDEKDLQECFHYTNMKPLLAEENLFKGNRYEEINMSNLA